MQLAEPKPTSQNSAFIVTYYSERVVTVGAVQVLIRTSHRTHPTVTASRQGDIIVCGPSTTTDAEATALVERRRSWIYRQLTRLTETAPDDPLKELVPGSEFDVLGQPHRLRIIPDDEQEEPSTCLCQAPTGAQLTLRRATALNPDKVQRTIINFYATTGQEWLKTHHGQIAAHAANQPLTGSFSTRIPTTWAGNHPTHGVTLHWATAQLPPTLLRELIRRTLNLPPSPATTTSTTPSAHSGSDGSPPQIHTSALPHKRPTSSTPTTRKNSSSDTATYHRIPPGPGKALVRRMGRDLLRGSRRRSRPLTERTLLDDRTRSRATHVEPNRRPPGLAVHQPRTARHTRSRPEQRPHPTPGLRRRPARQDRPDAPPPRHTLHSVRLTGGAVHRASANLKSQFKGLV